VSSGRALLVASVVALSASCTLFIDTSGFVGSSDAVDASDGATSADVSSADDAPRDVSPFELCKDPSFIVCETFDGPVAVDRYPRVTDPSTNVTFDNVGFFSPPGSVRFRIEPSGNTSPDAVLRMEPGVTVADFGIDAELFIESSEPGGVARLLYISNENTKSLIVEQSGAVVESGETRAQLGAIPLGRWLAVHIEIRTSKLPATASIKIGDATTNTISLHESWTEPGKPVFRFGVSEASSPTKGWLVRWDDVVIRKL
jgi:hypothetical protein